VEDYFGVDQALSLLKRPASERVAALSRFPDQANMPTDLVYELALNQTEAGDYDGAETLFHHRYFARAEGGTNVRQVWLEVRLQHALALGRAGNCESSLKIASELGSAVPELDFTQDGLQPILDSARNSYLLGELQAGCGHAEQAKANFERAAGIKGSGEIAWAVKAAKKLGNYDEAEWRARLLSTLHAHGRPERSLGAYNSAMLQLALGNETDADAGFRDALLMTDTQMAYHLSRLAMVSEAR
jgi:hypothetical protein